ncbi:MAG: hypothetical protein PHC64_10615 [Candidatus Gastranaerophilales bacterium]|nr:hypothetical protein [Candidatus Gastranaerophilales bacterium]
MLTAVSSFSITNYHPRKRSDVTFCAKPIPEKVAIKLQEKFLAQGIQKVSYFH